VSIASEVSHGVGLPLPLEGIRVVLLGDAPAGLIASSFLSDLGAEIIRVDLLGRDDPLRSRLPHFQGTSLSWMIMARSAKSVTCNLDDPEGAQLLQRLIEKCDIVIESFGPGIFEEYFGGLISSPSPLVLLRISAYGQTGPYKHFPSDDLTASAFAGLAHLTGHRDGPPLPMGTAMADHLCAVFAAQSGISALYRRLETGLGDIIDVPIYGGVLRITEWAIPAAHRLGLNREREGNSPRPAAPYGVFESEDHEFVAICVSNDDRFRRVTESEDDSGIDPAEMTPVQRAEISDELNAKLGRWAAQRSIDEIEAICLETGIPVGRVYSAREIISDSHVKYRGDLVSYDDDGIGPITQSGPYPKFQNSAQRAPTPPSDVGQDNIDIWCDLVGLSHEALELHTESGRI
jgi:succinyl-CoA--D-citramalate CoA-transferase